MYTIFCTIFRPTQLFSRIYCAQIMHKLCTKCAQFMDVKKSKWREAKMAKLITFRTFKKTFWPFLCSGRLAPSNSSNPAHHAAHLASFTPPSRIPQGTHTCRQTARWQIEEGEAEGSGEEVSLSLSLSAQLSVPPSVSSPHSRSLPADSLARACPIKQDRLTCTATGWEFKSSTGEFTDEEKKVLMSEVYSTQLYTFLHNCVHFRVILSNREWRLTVCACSHPSRRTQGMTSSSSAVCS
jgi:hypothetical protein